MNNVKIINIDKNNISEYRPVCFLNPNNIGYQKKLEWLKLRFSEGLKIKQLYLENEKKANGFIEYVPGEFAWRAVDAKDYMFIHCIWISPNKHKEKGYGSLLIEECVKDAKEQGKYGVAVVASEDSFMAGRDIFSKNGFTSVADAKPSFRLMIQKLKEGGTLPKFKDYETQLKQYTGWNIIYSNQCPWVARFIEELGEISEAKNLELKITELKTAKEAQNAPSVYSVFNLVHDGKLLADHYISATRFKNIIEKEVKK